VAIVGAGVIGLSIAWRLVQGGLQVLLLDRGEPGHEASGAAAGILSARAEAPAPGPLFELLWRSQHVFPAFVAELESVSGESCDFRQCGALHAARTEAEMDDLAEQRRWQAALGLRVESWDPATLRATEPMLSPEFLGASYFGESARVDPRRLCGALRTALAKGRTVFRQGEVQSLQRQGERVTGLWIDGEFQAAGSVILAAGAWSSRIPGSDLLAQAIKPVRGQLAGFSPASPLLQRVVFADGGYLLPVSARAAPSMPSQSTGDALIVGSTTENVGFERGVTSAAQEHLVARARRICPALEPIVPASAWSGLRPTTEDGLPALGPTPIGGLHLAVGHYRNGILLAPLTAALVTEALYPGSMNPTSLGPPGESLAIPDPVAALRLYA
jgi:glycine oxidase